MAHAGSGVESTKYRPNPISMSRLKTRGSGNAQAKMNEELVKQVRKAVMLGWRQDVLAFACGISKTQMHRIVHRKNWAHVRD